MLHYAVYSGTPEILEELVSAGADVNKKDRLGHTPLRNAMFVRETKITDKLLALGASLDVRTAAALGKTEEVSRFISADPQALDQEDADGYSAIDWAARRHQREILILMARTHPRVNIFRAAALGDERSVSDGLHTAPGSINSRDSHRLTPLDWAACAGNVEMAKYLIEHNADVNQSNAVVFAARAGYTDVVKLLLEHGPNPAKLEEAYQSAIAEHHSDAAELLRSSKK